MLSFLQKNKSATSILILIVCLLPACIGIFHSGFFVTDDGNWMIIRLSAFYQALRQGQFPVRYLPRLNNGYGYPVADFLYPLFLYFGSFIHIFHINFTTTIKIIFGISLFGSAIGVFLWLRQKFDNLSGLVASLIYALFPYHIWDITKRGSLGEVLAMAIVPYIFWAVDNNSIFWTSLSMGLLITAHNTLAVLFLPVVVVYIVLEKKIKLLFVSISLGLGVSAFFWLPAITDIKYTVFTQTAVSNFQQYFLSSNLYPLIGLVSFVVILLALFMALKKPNIIFLFFLVVTLFTISLTNSISKMVWVIFHLSTYIQFPFRFLSLTALGVSFVGGFMLFNWQKKYSFFLAGVFIVLLYLSSAQFFFAHEYSYNPDSYYSTNEDTTTVQNEYMPLAVKKQYFSPTHMSVISTPNATINSILDKGNFISFSVHAFQPAQITIGKVFFPGWKILVDNQQQKIQTNQYGFILVNISKGDHVVEAKFGETLLRLLADVVSVISLFILIVLYFLKTPKFLNR